jgi:hypothetical protein
LTVPHNNDIVAKFSVRKKNEQWRRRKKLLIDEPGNPLIEKMGDIGGKGADLFEDELFRAKDLADCTFDYIEARYGLDFATRAAEWLKTLGFRMKA